MSAFKPVTGQTKALTDELADEQRNCVNAILAGCENLASIVGQGRLGMTTYARRAARRPLHTSPTKAFL